MSRFAYTLAVALSLFTAAATARAEIEPEADSTEPAPAINPDDREFLQGNDSADLSNGERTQLNDFFTNLDPNGTESADAGEPRARVNRQPAVDGPATDTPVMDEAGTPEAAD
jgi:hypothetical protein